VSEDRMREALETLCEGGYEDGCAVPPAERWDARGINRDGLTCRERQPYLPEEWCYSCVAHWGLGVER
jgi:hypothetical protein